MSSINLSDLNINQSLIMDIIYLKNIKQSSNTIKDKKISNYFNQFNIKYTDNVILLALINHDFMYKEQTGYGYSLTIPEKYKFIMKLFPRTIGYSPLNINHTTYALGMTLMFNRYINHTKQLNDKIMNKTILNDYYQAMKKHHWYTVNDIDTTFNKSLNNFKIMPFNMLRYENMKTYGFETIFEESSYVEELIDKHIMVYKGG